MKLLKKKSQCALAREFFSIDKSFFLILFGIIVGARAPASAPAFFGVALRLALRGNFRSCAPTALRLLGTALRSGAPRSAAFQYSEFLNKNSGKLNIENCQEIRQIEWKFALFSWNVNKLSRIFFLNTVYIIFFSISIHY